MDFWACGMYVTLSEVVMHNLLRWVGTCHPAPHVEGVAQPLDCEHGNSQLETRGIKRINVKVITKTTLVQVTTHSAMTESIGGDVGILNDANARGRQSGHSCRMWRHYLRERPRLPC